MPIRGQPYSFRVRLFDADGNVVRNHSPQSGDFSITTDGGMYSLLATVPSESPAGSGWYLVSLTSTETDGDEAAVGWEDAAGDEWLPGGALIKFDVAAALTAADVWSHAERSLTTFGMLVDDIASAVWAATTRTLSAFGFTVAAVVDEAVIAEATNNLLSAAHGTGSWEDRDTAGAGAIAHTITVTDGSNPLDGAEVWVTTDQAGSNVVASGVTDTMGRVTLWLDAGDYYLWAQLSGYNPPAGTYPVAFEVSE